MELNYIFLVLFSYFNSIILIEYSDDKSQKYLNIPCRIRQTFSSLQLKKDELTSQKDSLIQLYHFTQFYEIMILAQKIERDS